MAPGNYLKQCYILMDEVCLDSCKCNYLENTIENLKFEFTGTTSEISKSEILSL